jgi:hypothetical protein
VGVGTVERLSGEPIPFDKPKTIGFTNSFDPKPRFYLSPHRAYDRR